MAFTVLQQKDFRYHGCCCNVQAPLYSNGATIMSKAQDSKKAVKKEPAKSPKEKKEAKKVKKEASKRQ